MFNAAVIRKLVMFKQGSKLPPATIFSAGTTKFYELSHWRDHHIAPLIRAAISVVYEKHQMASETKAWRNRATHLNCAAATWTVYQLGSIIERRCKQTGPSSELLYSGTDADLATLLQHSAARSSEKRLYLPQNE